MAKHVFQIGDSVKFYTKRYVRGSRGPGRPARYTYRFAGMATLISRYDQKAMEADPASRGKTVEEIKALHASHVGYLNATGSKGEDGLTDGNNVVDFNGEIRWVDREQIRNAK